MRKWPKKYFLDALAVHPDFLGEVELIDNFIELDYFEAYKANKKLLQNRKSLCWARFDGSEGVLI